MLKMFSFLTFGIAFVSITTVMGLELQTDNFLARLLIGIIIYTCSYFLGKLVIGKEIEHVEEEIFISFWIFGGFCIWGIALCYFWNAFTFTREIMDLIKINELYMHIASILSISITGVLISCIKIVEAGPEDEF